MRKECVQQCTLEIRNRVTKPLSRTVGYIQHIHTHARCDYNVFVLPEYPSNRPHPHQTTPEPPSPEMPDTKYTLTIVLFA